MDKDTHHPCNGQGVLTVSFVSGLPIIDVPFPKSLLRDAIERSLEASGVVFDVAERDLDRNSQKIRNKAGSPEALMNPWWQNFLCHLSNKVILSTAFIECLFAHVKTVAHPQPKPRSTAHPACKAC